MNRSIVRGRIRVEMPPPVGLLLVVPRLLEFKAKYPETHLEVGCSDRVVDLVEGGSTVQSEVVSLTPTLCARSLGAFNLHCVPRLLT
jgi:DNA-binding transcriptional LysR family regulator